MDESKQFDRVTAIFNPKRTDDLTEDAKQFIDKTAEFQYLSRREDGESYAQMWMLGTVDPNISIGWVPECDINIIN